MSEAPLRVELQPHTDVDQYDDDPEDSHPRGDGDGVRPELQHSIDSLKLVRDGDEVVEPVGPTDSKTSSWIDELGRPLHKSGWERVPVSHVQRQYYYISHPCTSNSHHSHLANTLRHRPDHTTRQ
jgi:hypothetical protein